MARLKLTLSYCGGLYAGWQIQAKSRKTNTIQQELERALETIAGGPVRVHGAGRTDSGVHAEGQVAHADVPEKPVDGQRALNALLPRDIRILAAEPVAAAFHARHDATGKVYAYTVFSGHLPVPPRLEPFVWALPPLDVAAMEATAAILTGRHDFASFQNTGTPIANTVREVWSIRRDEGRAGAFLCPEHWPVTTWFFHGNGFLKQMIRNMMGLIVWAGQGRIDAASAAACLAAKNRQAVPSPTAPARGLTLMRVEYS
jgi:tRNA pseudouridine38-40 synthase